MKHAVTIWRIFSGLMGLTAALAVSGCANLQVTKVTDENNESVAGIHYCLPKPFIQVTPQADGTVAVDVLYLPDKSHEYAINPSSRLSSYTFQISRDEKGLLTALEYKASTTAVGQQLAASAGGAAVQAYNINAARAVALQSQVNAAQTAVDTARSNYEAARAVLDSDTKRHDANPAYVTDATLTSDTAAVAQAAVKLQVAQNVLQRAQTTAQVASVSAAAGSVATLSVPTMGTAFGQPTWNIPATYNLPDKFAPVLFAVNDTLSQDASGKKTVNAVELKAVTSLSSDVEVKDEEYHEGVKHSAQPAFATTSNALGPPILFPADQSAPATAKQLVFYFDRPIKSLGSGVVTTDADSPTVATTTGKASADFKSISVDITAQPIGSYVLTVFFSYAADARGHTMSGTQKVRFKVTDK